MRRLCMRKLKAEGVGMCGNPSCDGCKYKGDIPTANTLKYIQTLIAYKRTHIERERKRLKELELMETELLSVVQ